MNSNETALPDCCKRTEIQSPQRRICHCVHCWYNAFLLELWRVGGGWRGGVRASVAALICSHLEQRLLPPQREKRNEHRKHKSIFIMTACAYIFVMVWTTIYIMYIHAMYMYAMLSGHMWWLEMCNIKPSLCYDLFWLAIHSKMKKALATATSMNTNSL